MRLLLLALSCVGVVQATYYGYDDGTCSNAGDSASCPSPSASSCISYKCSAGNPGVVEVDLSNCYTTGHNVLRSVSYELIQDGKPWCYQLEQTRKDRHTLAAGNNYASFHAKCGATIKVFPVDSTFVQKDTELGWSESCAYQHSSFQDTCNSCAYTYEVDCGANAGDSCQSDGPGGACVSGGAYDSGCNCQDAPAASGTECSTGSGCIKAGVCDGSSTECQNGDVDVGAPCDGAPDELDGPCVESFTCAADGSCSAPVYKGRDVVCRGADSSGCDVEETCTGRDAACPSNDKVAVGTSCSTGEDEVIGPCGGATTCNAEGRCVIEYEPSTKRCARGSDCKEDSFCTGSSIDCPPADNAEPGTECEGDGSKLSKCEESRTCNSGGVCVSNPKSNDVVCRGGSDCDPAEKCDGSSLTCPDNEFSEKGTSCGVDEPRGGCLRSRKCDGEGTCVDRVKDKGTVCREAVDRCDAAEYCDGESDACPGDGSVDDDTTCGGVTVNTGECAEKRVCLDGDCTVVPKSKGTPCGAAPGDCEIAPTCDGESLDCPAPKQADDGEECGERMSGACVFRRRTCEAGVCKINYKPSSFVCRAGGPCDPPEFCTGDSSVCPRDRGASDGTPCEGDVDSSGKECVKEYQCLAKECTPVIVPAADRQVCRAANSSGCDKTEYCSGEEGCPRNRFKEDGTDCGPDKRGVCQKQSKCDAGKCVERYFGEERTCREGTGPCDPSTVCPGDQVDCPEQVCRDTPLLAEDSAGKDH